MVSSVNYRSTVLLPSPSCSRQTHTCSSGETDSSYSSAIGLLMMVEEGSFVEVCKKCCVLVTVARWFSKVAEEGGDCSLSSSANGFLMMVAGEDSEEEEWSRCSLCTLAQ